MSINFFRGHPTNSLLARKEILQASIELLKPETRDFDDVEDDRHPLAYGTDPGSLAVRNTIASWNGPRIGEKDNGVSGNHLNLTNGASFGAHNALNLCTNAASGYTRKAYIVSPTYFLINDVFHDNGFSGKLTSVLETDKGIDLDGLIQDLEADSRAAASEPKPDLAGAVGESRSNNRYYKYVLYIIPSFSNPRGKLVSLEQRQKLIDIARKYDVLILCDDVYDLLNYSDKPVPPRLVWLDRETLPENDKYGHVISNNTFSKLFGPGLRVGWQETATPELALQLSTGGSIRSGGTPAQLNSFIAQEMIKNRSADKIIDNLLHVYAERSAFMLKTMKDLLPAGTTIEGGEGGYFMWVTLPEKYRKHSREIVQQGKKRGVILPAGENFEVAGDHKDYDASYRLCFAYLENEQTYEGIKIWAEILKNFD